MARPHQPEHPPPSLVTNTEALEAACQRLHREAYVTVDTEFMRERTYWPELCLVQLAGEQEVVMIDTLADGIDLAPLGRLLADPAVMKVFHAARQDIEIFVLRFGDVPKPMFDTQIGAMVAGFGDQVGYDALVSGVTGGSIDKAHRFSDWSVRPLSTSQLNYAAADVTHLREVYRRLRARLEQEGRLEWVAQEMATLANPDTYRADPDTMWERLKPRSNSRKFLGLLQAVAAWREREAQRVNIPRQRVLKDETLLEIAATAPTTPEALARARGVTRGFAEGRTGASLLEVITAARAVPDNKLPLPTQTRDAVRPSAALVALLKVLLSAKCEEHHVAPRLVASSDDLDRIALEDLPDVPALHGWRRIVFGEDALALRQGRMALGVNGRRVSLIPIGEPEAASPPR
jgi:ribonuclease D